MQDYKVDITPENAKTMVIDESFNRPVLVDFWADWCAPCKSLMPLLDKLADEYQGAFLLAKVNADEQQMLAAQFGVQSLPTVMLIKDGQPIDGFTGAQPENELRKFLEPHLPKPWDEKLALARGLMDEEKFNEALAPLKQAYQESNERADIAIALAEVQVQLNRLDEAQALLDKIKMVDQDQQYHHVMAQLELAQNAEKAPEIAALEDKLAQSPDDEDIKFQLAVQYSQHQYHKEALELLFSVLQKNLNAKEGEVRKAFSDVLEVLGKGDPLAVQFQRKLYSLIY